MDFILLNTREIRRLVSEKKNYFWWKTLTGLDWYNPRVRIALFWFRRFQILHILIFQNFYFIGIKVPEYCIALRFRLNKLIPVFLWLILKFLQLFTNIDIQGVPKNMGIQWRIRYRLCYELPLQYLISKAIILLCLLEFI